VIAADTSTWIAYLQGESGADVSLLDRALQDRAVVMAPAVLTELLSEPKLPAAIARMLMGVPMLEIKAGHWERAGRLRSAALARRRKARLGDALIAQSCLDQETPLLTRDKDFTAFADAAGFSLLNGWIDARARGGTPPRSRG
jgi:predicted nucleic acid-binding protein